MNDKEPHGPIPRTPNYRRRRIVAGTAVAGLVALGIVKAADQTSRPTPVEQQAIDSEETLTRLASAPEGLYVPDSAMEDSPLSDTSVRLHKGVTLRRTPAIINNDPDAGISSNAFTKLGDGKYDELRVTRPLLLVDENGDRWYGFTLGPVMNPPQPDAAKATVWVNSTELYAQERARGIELIDETMISNPVENKYITYSPVSGYNIVDRPNTADQGINIAFAEAGR